jgi:sugar lactone lactonase YvrE
MIPLDSVSFVGEKLERPECVLCTRAGNLYVSDRQAGVMMIRPDGSQQRVSSKDPGVDLIPNGIALMSDGSFLLANLGKDEGGVFRLDSEGTIAPFCLEADGVRLPPTNFVHLDTKGRVWITVSTRVRPRADAYRPDACDGFIVLVRDGKAHIVADGLGYTNECLVDPSGKWLYVNETFARKLSRFPLTADGSLGEKETVSRFGNGVFPDGMAFDDSGGVWIVSIVSNRVIRVAPDGGQTVILDDSDPEHLAWVEQAFQNHLMGRPHLDQVKSKHLKNISSIAFGGKDLKTVYLGCLLGDTVTSFRSEIAGAPPVHWYFDD